METPKQSLESVFREYDSLVKKGAYLAAIVKLGEVLASASQSTSEGPIVDRIKAQTNATVLSAATAEAIGARQRASRILSIGAKFTWDEIVLLITLRLEIELTANVLRLFGHEVRELDLAALDIELRELAHSKWNRQTFVSALATIRKNWAISIRDQWSTA